MARTALHSLSLQTYWENPRVRAVYEVWKKPSGPARIANGPHTGILSIARARCELKQLCCYIRKSRLFGQNEQHSEFCYLKKKKKQKEKRDGHIIKCLLTDLGRAGRKNIWHSVKVHRPRYARSVRQDLGPNIFPSGLPTQSISTYSLSAIYTSNFSLFFLIARVDDQQVFLYNFPLTRFPCSCRWSASFPWQISVTKNH